MASPTFYQIFQRLLRSYGHQHWWPAQSAFEVMVGAVLTQNTSWTNVERALENIKNQNALSVSRLAKMPHKQLARLLTPVGYFNVKATRLKHFCQWYHDQGGVRRLQVLPTGILREKLLTVHGIGPETADDMLLYAFERPVFVIDAYTRRLFQRLALIEGNESYEKLRSLFEQKLARRNNKVALFNEYHALIVHHAKYVCRNKPRCEACCLRQCCERALISNE